MISELSYAYSLCRAKYVYTVSEGLLHRLSIYGDGEGFGSSLGSFWGDGATSYYLEEKDSFGDRTYEHLSW